MHEAKAVRAVRLDDGRVLLEQPDGSFCPAASVTDDARIAQTSDDTLTAAAEADPDNPPIEPDFWARAALQLPRRKEGVYLRLDPDVVAWFRRDGRGYQTRINAALRLYIAAHAGRRG